MTRLKSRSGFSLVEVLIVVLIASIVLGVLATVLGSSFEILRTGETRSQLNSQARTALNYITEDIMTASYIVANAFDRDLNGYADEMGLDQETGLTVGFNEEAPWRVAWMNTNDIAVVASSFFISEAWGDRIMTVHDSSVTVGDQIVDARSFSVPKTLTIQGENKVAEYSSFFRLAIPADNDMPYYLALEWDRNGDGAVTAADLRNTGSFNPDIQGDGWGEIVGYPSVVPVGPHKETAVLIQDLNAEFLDGTTRRFRQIPITSNITRVKYEYLHEVPVYVSRNNGGDIEIAYQDLIDGQIYWVGEDWERSTDQENRVPLINNWELRVVDVAHNSAFEDGVTGALYGGMDWQLADQYPEGFDPNKADGTHINPNSLSGLGQVNGGTFSTGWNCNVFYNIDSNGDDSSDNAPIDRLAYVTTSISGPNEVEGGMAYLRPDMEPIHGSRYYNYTENPTQIGDLGDADGIPDGDGIPDDPVPGWWLPYVRAVRVSIIATPRRVIDERRAKSGEVGSTGTAVYYRLDSPIPFGDPNRLEPLLNQRKDYVGEGKDLILTKTVPVDYVYNQELVSDLYDTRISDQNSRRAELNYFNGARATRRDLFSPDDLIHALTPLQKLFEKDPSLP